MSVETLSIGADRRLTTAYGVAHFGKSLFWHCSGLLLAFFLTEVVGMPPSSMGFALGLSLLASAASDMVVGRVWRETLSRPLTAARLQFGGSLLASFALLALFVAPLMPPPHRFAWAWIALMALRIGYSLYDTPQNALMALATHDAATRSRTAALRVGISGLAALVLAAIIMPLLVSTSASDLRARSLVFIGLGVAMSLIAVGAAWALLTVIRRTKGSNPVPTATTTGDPPTPAPSLNPAFPGRSAVTLAPLLVMAFAFPFSMSAFGKLEPYYVTYVVKSPVWAGVLATAGALGVVASPLVWNRVARLKARRLAFMFASLGLLAACVAFGLTARAPMAAAAAVAAIGVMGGGLNILIWATVADEAATRERTQVGAIFGLLTAVSKTAPALSVLGLGLLLGRMDYRGADGDRLIALMIGFPIAGALTCALVAALWHTSRSAPVVVESPQPARFQSQIQAQIQARRPDPAVAGPARTPGQGRPPP